MKDGSKVIEARDVVPGMTLIGRVYTEPDGSTTTKRFARHAIVKTVDECRGAWRSKVHIDGGCWNNVDLLRVR